MASLQISKRSKNSQVFSFQELRKQDDSGCGPTKNDIDIEVAGKKEQTLVQYHPGFLNNARKEYPSNPTMTYTTIQKKNLCKENMYGINDSVQPPEQDICPTFPPSYDEAMAANNAVSPVSTSPRILTYRELNATLRNFTVDTGIQSAHLLYTCPNVQIYFISRDGTVKATSKPDTLEIMEVEDDASGRPGAYLHVGDWVYPLVPGVSPCLKTDYRAFILPDIHSPKGGDAVGIILPEDSDESLEELLNDILCGLAQIVPRETTSKDSGEKKRDLSTNVSQGIVKGAEWISHGMIRGAEKAGQFMNNRTPKLMDRIEPKEKQTSINPKVQSGMKKTKNVTEGAVGATNYVTSKVRAATLATGRYLVPHIQKQGTRLLSATSKYSEQEASSKVNGVLEVVAGAAKGFATVEHGLEKAAAILGISLATNTVKVVEHKYGDPAGAVTGEAFDIVGDIFVIGNNIRHLTPDGLLEVAAIESGKAIENYQTSQQSAGEGSQFKHGDSSKAD